MRTISIILFVLLLSSCAFLKSVFSPPIRPEGFSVDLRSPQVEVGETEAYFNTAFGGFKKTEVTGLYFPIDDVVCLRYKTSNVTFYQFWNRNARDTFIKGFEQYNEDFEARSLVRRNSKTRNIYGTFLGFLIWQEFSFSVQSKGNMDFELGHFFRQGSPFFTVIQGEAHFLNADSKKNRVSGEKPMYMTRAQAEEVAAFFDQELLVSFIPPELLPIIQSAAERRNIPSTFDDY